MISAIGSNLTVKNCYFENISIPRTSSLIDLSDKATYYNQFPYVYNKISAFFENLTFNFISAFDVNNVADPNLLALPLLIRGSHSLIYPSDYTFRNVIMTNNIASIFFFLLLFNILAFNKNFL